MNDKKVSPKKKKIKEKIRKTVLERIKAVKKASREEKKKRAEKSKLEKSLIVRRWLKNIFYLLLIAFFLAGGALFFWVTTLKIPDINEIHRLKIAQSTKIYDSTGEVLLYNVHGDETRTVVPIENISKYAQQAAVAIEDKDFYNHHGIKITSILKAAWDNFWGTGRFKRGGSTITQQVIKNTLLTREKTYTRKIKEAILAYKLEKLWTKDQILELYLNEAPYGGTIYGIEEAALYYFNKHASELDIAESAYLAAMPQAPTTYSPYGKHRKTLDARKDTVLRLMLNQGYITPDQYKEAREEEVEFVFKTKTSGLKAPHFVMYVIKQLEEMYGKEALKTDGLKVITSLNYDLQEKMQEIVKENALVAEKDYGAENAAAVAIESKSGNIIAMVGSRDYFDESIDGKVNITTAKRQPGSSFKPYVYLTALEMGYTPKTVIWDVDTEFSLSCDPTLPDVEARRNKNCYRPKNFDWYTDHPFKGPMKLENALPESRNIPAIKMLYLVGVDKAIANAKLFGIKSLNKPASFYGLSLVLGGGEVQLLNHVSAYSTFSNEGIRIEPVAILEVRDDKDNLIYEHRVEKKRVIDAKYVQNLNKILSTDSLKYPTFGVNSSLYFNNRVASKTGTTNNNKDSWTVGYDAGNFAVGVWIGNNDNRSAKRNPGKITYKIWRDSVKELLKLYPTVDFPEAPSLINSETKPSLRGIIGGGTTIKIDIKTGTLATDETPEEFIKEIVIPSYHSILHWVDKSNPTGPVPEEKDPAYENWEYGVQKWVVENSDKVQEQIQNTLEELLQLTGNSGLNIDSTRINTAPRTMINNNSLDFRFLSPGNGDRFRKKEKIYVKLRQTGPENIRKYFIYVNGKYLASTTRESFSFRPSDVDNIKVGENIIKIAGQGMNGDRLEKIVTIQVED